MRIAIMGSGGVGGYFGGRLAAAGTDVTFIARGEHLAALRDRGLRVESPLGNIHLPRVTAVEDPASIAPVDLIFFTLKLYDTEAGLRTIAPLVGPKTVVVSFQNGVESVDAMTRAFGRGHVAGGTTYVAAVIAEPGVIRHTAMNRLIFGSLDGSRMPVLEELLETSRSAGFEGVLTDRIMVDIWEKFARLTVFSGMTAVARAPIGKVVNDPELFAMLEAALHESIAVARGRQVPLPGRMFDEVIAAFRSLPPHAKSSMLEDLERGRPLELPWLSGAVVRIGEAVGVPTPTHRQIVALLRTHVAGHREPEPAKAVTS
jgi:2-dehydropantoate 2-reductase